MYLTSTKQTSGFSILELVVALVIVAIIASISVSRFSGFKSKARLNTASNVTLDLLLLAQNYAISNSMYTQVCLIDNDDGQNAQAMVTAHPSAGDLTGDGGMIGQDPTDGGSYRVIKQAVFDSGITFCQPFTGTSGLLNGACSKYTMWLGWNYCVIFKPDGNLDNSPGYVPDDLLEITTLSVPHYQSSICIISKEIDNQSQSAREIEISASGQINLVPRGGTGDLTAIAGNGNNTPELSAGVGECSNLNLIRRSL